MGKTEASFRYSNWSLVEANLAVRTGVPVKPEELLDCDILYYKPGITVSAQRLKRELAFLSNQFRNVKERAISWHRPADWAAALQKKQVNLIIVDEAHRLKYLVLEELRDLQEKWEVGIVLIGDTGMERSLGRMFHFAARVLYLEKFEPLSPLEISQYTDKQVELLALPKPSAEVYALIAAYSRGNPRTLGHLFALIQRLLKINDDIVQEITVDVVDMAREMMLVGLCGTPLTAVETPPPLASAV